jgi:hypothetical protein
MPDVSLEAFSIVLAALGLLALVVAIRRLFRARLFAAAKSTLTGLLLITSAAALLVVSSNLHSYARLTHGSRSWS